MKMNLFTGDHKIPTSDYWLRHVSPSACPPLHLHNLSSQWREIHEIWHLSTFRTSFEKVKISLKRDLMSHKDLRYMSPNSSQNACFGQSSKEIQTHNLGSETFFP